MNKIKFDFSNSKITDLKYKKYEKDLQKEIKNLNNASKKKYLDLRCSINLPLDNKILNESKLISNKLRSAQTIVVIGIGGSNLGTIAVYEALRGKLYNQTQKKKVYFADTCDSNSISEISNLIKADLIAGKKVILNAISKSGGTTETIANFEILLNVVKKYAKYDYKKYVVITTGKKSPFEKYAISEKFSILNLPDNVGGRYSVFSNVGIFPLIFLGVDCKKLFLGAKDIRVDCLSKSIVKNPAMKSAVTIYEMNKSGKNIFNTFIFCSQFESVGKWYRQLLGESIGKEFNLNKKKINVGVTPTVAIGSTDLHSLSQLYLGGPNDKLHCFVKINNVKLVKLGNDKKLDLIVSHLQNKKFEEIMSAIYLGTTKAFTKKKIPYYEIELEEISEYTVGALLQMKMIEVMFLGSLYNVNPFDQPNVEDYKIITKKILSGVENGRN